MNKCDLKDGMIVTLRRGVDRVVIGRNLLSRDVVICNGLHNYNDDLTHLNNCESEDIMKIEYGGEIIWERGIEWEKVSFGTEVRGWKANSENKQVGKFLIYDENDENLPFLVFIENEKQAIWFNHCELLGEEDE